MLFSETKLSGAYVIHPERLEDERGFFARSWCQKEFEQHGLNYRLVQCNISFNRHTGTLRGMHYQVEPREEAKLVRCTRGAIFDVVVDLRPESATFREYVGLPLSAENRTMLYVPKKFAHGFITLEDNTEVFYQMSEFYAPECARGFRWNDRSFNIKWPLEATVISERDSSYGDWSTEL